MRIVDPDPMLEEASSIIEPIKNSVVLVGAAAIQIALSESSIRVTPTTDLDFGVERSAIEEVILHLEAQEMEESTLPHEAGFTWVKGGIKVQLIREFVPFPQERVARLPQNDLISLLSPENVWEVAFTHDPERVVLRAARPGALIVLKEKALGRERPDHGIVKRDFSDIALLIENAPREIAEDARRAPSTIRPAVKKACVRLIERTEERDLALDELVAIGHAASRADGNRNLLRSAKLLLSEIED